VLLLIALSETVYSVDMDVEQEFGIKTDRSIVVLGVAHTDKDEDITATLKKYGTVTKVVRLSTTEEEDKCNAIVEFESAAANALVEPKLPFDIQNIRDTVVTWRVDSIKVLTQTVTDSSDSDGSSSTDSDHSTTPLIHRSRKKIFDKKRYVDKKEKMFQVCFCLLTLQSVSLLANVCFSTS